jgi:hypothetical protein
LLFPKLTSFEMRLFSVLNFVSNLHGKQLRKLWALKPQPPKQVLREMAQNGFIENVDLWFDFLENQNLSSHTYDQVLSEKVFTSAQLFLPEGKKLQAKLKAK